MKITHAVVLTLALGLAAPAMAQNTSPTTGNNTGTSMNAPSTANNAKKDDDNDFDYGWLGLLGLAGLAGLMKRDRHPVVHTTSTTQPHR